MLNDTLQIFLHVKSRVSQIRKLWVYAKHCHPNEMQRSSAKRAIHPCGYIIDVVAELGFNFKHLWTYREEDYTSVWASFKRLEEPGIEPTTNIEQELRGGRYRTCIGQNTHYCARFHTHSYH